ncbi:hypothetical protein EUX98_g1380 [Antrodiella citrinella]|uniref:F-box domain-containing protein n=1 Tax=Antrodiella citrinella TaxID=2447956 RepID=A0A4S4N358_9APHY|nr:hypothetical protein EUX98_g1380 [Antrodiella citrinella]
MATPCRIINCSKQPSPRLPIEICERIIDSVAWSDVNTAEAHEGDEPSLLCCILVCRAWVPRCRFVLSYTEVDLRSHNDLVFFSRFFAVYPHTASNVEQLRIYGRKENETSTYDSWFSSVPAMLPALPNLVTLSILDVDLSHQHPNIFMLYSKFKLASELVHGLILTRVSFLHFSQVARLAYAIGARTVSVDRCPLSLPIFNSRVNRLPPPNTLHTVIEMEISSDAWSELIKVPSDWLLAFPNLQFLEITLPRYKDADNLKQIDPFAQQHGQDWFRLCELSRGLVSRSVQPKEISVHMSMVLFDVFIDGVPGGNPKLTLKAYDRDAAPCISALAKALPLLSRGYFGSVEIDLNDMLWIWEDHTPELWKAVDDALVLHHPSLTRFIFHIVSFIPYHDVFTRRYGCEDNFRDALFPQMAQRAIIERECVNEDCAIHCQVEYRKVSA